MITLLADPAKRQVLTASARAFVAGKVPGQCDGGTDRTALYGNDTKMIQKKSISFFISEYLSSGALWGNAAHADDYIQAQAAMQVSSM